MQLDDGEKIIKEGIVHYRGGGIRKPLIFANAYGKLYLTNKRLVLEYFYLAVPTTNDVKGIFKRRIEIPLNKIKKVNNVTYGWEGIVKVEYEEGDGTSCLYFAPWKAFASLSLTDIAHEWIKEIQQSISL